MDRAYESGSSESAPLAPETPSIGYPTAGNPGGGTPATKPGPWWYHMVTEEVRNVILAAGLTPDHGDLSQLSAAIQSLIDLGRLPVASVIYVAGAVAPAGCLKANGAAVSRAAYAELFTVIGTIFGVGDGSTTFNLPDLRGEFIRGWDDGRGVDTGRGFGAMQNGEFESHTHLFSKATAVYNTSGGGSYWSSGTNGAQGISQNVVATGGSETRPRNVALLACIKF